MALHLAQDEAADRLLSENPIALLIGMVLDQQVRLESAFAAPLELQRRLGKKLSAKTIAQLDPDVLKELFTRKHSLHRFPGSMAERVRQLCVMVTEDWGGKPERIWETATSGEELVARIEALPGFGKQKARIFTALLGKQLGCRPKGWREASGAYGEPGAMRSVADIVDTASLNKVREAKKAAKAQHKAESAR